jgi:FGGY-family pentulose kinase
MKPYFLGVDVGTSSVRAALFDSNGKLIDLKINQIQIFNPKVDFYEQSSEEIWSSVCQSIRSILNENLDIKSDEIVSIGFDATCSLVVLDGDFRPVTVSDNSNDAINVIMWMDHRAVKQTEFINATNHECLKYVGGAISFEMDPPKILWLKENLYERCYSRAKYFFSLPDFLVWKCSNTDIRSVCTTNCKWLYKSEPTTSKWDASFWSKIGLNELTLDNFKAIGTTVVKPFNFIEDLKISPETAKLTGLNMELKVGISMIDAHAGGIGGISVTLGFIEQISIEEILVLVSGTSSCLMTTTKSPKQIKSIWGPYYSAMVPNFWLNESGQSASGKLLEYITQSHPMYSTIKRMADGLKNSVFDILDEILSDMAKKQNKTSKEQSMMTQNIHIYPDFHGNRSPLADNQMTGTICGLKIDNSLENLALLYLATIQSLAYQTKHIINVMKENGCHFKVLTLIGGLAMNKTYGQLLSDIIELPVLLSTEKVDSIVLLGSAILGASNYKENEKLPFDDLIRKFGKSNSVSLLEPNDSLKKFHEKKYQVYLRMLEDQLEYRRIMQDN